MYETKPATEWIRGGPVQKVCPRYAHAVMQAEFTTRLCALAHERGRVGPEWRFWLTPTGEESRYLVPDIACLSYARLAREERDAAEEPLIAPNVAVEIVSPGDHPGNVDHKIDVYLRSGTAVVLQADPARRAMRAHDCPDMRELSEAETLEHAALPGFSLALAELLAELDR